MLLMNFGLTGNEKELRLDEKLFVCDECFFHFLSAAFFKLWDSSQSGKRNIASSLASARHGMMEDLAEQLKRRGFEPGLTERRAARLLYFKASEQVEDLLTAMGATSASLEIMEQKVYKGLRNKANRIANCENANIDKIVTASGSALEAVRVLRENQCFETLSEELKQVARLREEYPEYSLAELGQLLDPPLSRAGVCHRMKKLTTMAQEIQKRSREGKA